MKHIYFNWTNCILKFIIKIKQLNMSTYFFLFVSLFHTVPTSLRWHQTKIHVARKNSNVRTRKKVTEKWDARPRACVDPPHGSSGKNTHLAGSFIATFTRGLRSINIADRITDLIVMGAFYNTGREFVIDFDDWITNENDTSCFFRWTRKIEMTAFFLN